MAFKSILNSFNRKISLKLAFTGFGFAIILSLVTAAAQLAFEMRIYYRDTIREINHLANSAQLPAQNALFSYDIRQAQEIANGLLMNNAIISAEIFDEYGKVVASAGKGGDALFTRHYLNLLIGDPIQEITVDLNLSQDYPDLVGKMVIRYNLHSAFQTELKTTWIRLLSVLSVIAVFTFILISLFNRMLAKPVELISHQLSEIDLSERTGVQLGGLYSHRKDELGALVKSINSQLAAVDDLFEKNDQALKDTESSYQSLHTLVESLPHIITVASLDGIIRLVNQAFLKTFQVKPEEIIDRKLVDILASKTSESSHQLINDAIKETLISDRSVLLPEVNWLFEDGRHLSLEMRFIKIQYKGSDAILTASIDTSERKSHQARIQHLAYHDSLTDLPNRHLFIDRLEQALLRAQRSNKYGALVLIDLDDFKAINDTKGHLAGDTVLSEIAKRISTNTPKLDTVARVGGDEFLICMTDLSVDEREAHEIAIARTRRIMERLKQPFKSRGEQLQVNASLGLALFHDHSMTASELLRNADMAMHHAKRKGKNQFILFEKELEEAHKLSQALIKDCHTAIKESQFYLQYQPQFDSRTNRIIGTEALLRWLHPSQGMIPPSEFIPILEENDLMNAVGELVLEQAIGQVAEWQRADLLDEHFQMCINVSPQQFRQSDFTRTVRSIILKQNVAAQMIDLEITEGMIIDDIDHTVDSMNKLRDLGVRFSIDDFGTGYSSLNYLKRLPVDTLKVDQSFIRDLPNDVNDRAIVRTILAMSHQLGLKTIAEGVETEEQLLLVQEMGCYVYQGYLYSPPLETVEFEQLLRLNNTQS
jgi:diguanylate cyclase (GGDEF)-like protein/PAS domain S-box-containing protein